MPFPRATLPSLAVAAREEEHALYLKVKMLVRGERYPISQLQSKLRRARWSCGLALRFGHAESVAGHGEDAEEGIGGTGVQESLRDAWLGGTEPGTPSYWKRRLPFQNVSCKSWWKPKFSSEDEDQIKSALLGDAHAWLRPGRGSLRGCAGCPEPQAAFAPALPSPCTFPSKLFLRKWATASRSLCASNTR